MKFVLVVLSAAVLSGLGVYGVFSAAGAFGLMANAVVVNIDVFIGLIAVLATVSAAVALSLRLALAGAERDRLAGLESRLQELERRDGGGGTPPSV
jgi:hypothetical protein